MSRTYGPNHDMHCEAEFIAGPMLWTNCGCAERLVRPPMTVADVAARLEALGYQPTDGITVHEDQETDMTTTAAPVCTASGGDPATATVVTLPCGCQDVHYSDGTICFEHAHIECDGEPR